MSDLNHLQDTAVAPHDLAEPATVLNGQYPYRQDQLRKQGGHVGGFILGEIHRYHSLLNGEGQED